jgi:hypothetical protein
MAETFPMLGLIFMALRPSPLTFLESPAVTLTFA